MIDNSSAFQGQAWELDDAPLRGICYSIALYGPNPSIRAFESWLDALADLSWSILEEAFELLPREWVDGDEPRLMELLKRLHCRRERVPALVLEAISEIERCSRNAAHFVLRMPPGRHDARALKAKTPY